MRTHRSTFPGQIEPFFGTLDENVRLLEESLRVRTHLHDTRLTIEANQTTWPGGENWLRSTTT